MLFRYLLLITSLAVLSDAIVIDCTYAVRTLWNIPNVYYCEARIIVTGDRRQVTQIRGTHMSGRTHADIRGFRIQNQQLEALPRNLNQYFPYIEAVTVLHGRLNEISREDLVNLPNLRQLDMNFNSIQILGKDLFEGNPKLEFISFDNNLIRHVAHHVFDKLPLTILALRPTTCINEAQTNRAAVSDMIFRVFQQCPPTSRMIAEEILFDPRLMNVIDNRVDQNTYPLRTHLSNIGQQVNEHEQRIAEQKIQTKAAVDNINFLLARVFPQG